MKKNLKSISWCLLFFIFSCTLHAQENIPFNQFRFYVMPSLYPNLDVVKNNVDETFSSNIGYGGELGIGYYQNIIRGLGANLGVGYSLQSHNYHYSFVNTQDISVSETQNELRHLITVPLSLNYYVPLKNNHWLWNFELGMKMNFDLSTHYEYSGSSYGTVSYPHMDNNWDVVIDYKPNPLTISYFFKTGFSKITKKDNTIQLNFVANFLPQSFGDGTFKVQTKDGMDEGSFKYKKNFIGVEFIYGLKLCKKK